MRTKLLIMILLFCRLNFSQTDFDEKKVKLNYEIFRDEKLLDIKRSVDVRVNRILSEEELRKIANEIKKQDDNNYERTFISYYLPGMIVDEGAWATTHFNPDLKIYQGSSPDDIKLLKQINTEIDEEIIGKWIDERLTQKIIFYRESGKIYRKVIFKDGSIGKYEMLERNTNNGTRFDDVKGPAYGDHFVVNKKGELELWDDLGLIYKIQKAK